MPSDAASSGSGGRALARAHDVFHSALSITVEQARGTLAAQQADETVESAELGTFAEDRIDGARFTSLFARRRNLDAAAIERMQGAFAVLQDVAARAAETNVEPGASLRATVDRALADLGRAFGAARVFELARTGRFREDEHGSWLQSFPFALWNRAERAVAPPLVVSVNGRDLRADALGEFLDGVFKLVLVVRGDAPFAPLVRLITPGTFVMQTDDEAALARLGLFEGPGIAALVAKPAACFVHDPKAGDELHQRLVIDSMPDVAPPPVGGRSAAQQREELAQLEACARRPEASAPEAPGGVPAAAGDPVDKLAAWLLTQADAG